MGSEKLYHRGGGGVMIYTTNLGLNACADAIRRASGDTQLSEVTEHAVGMAFFNRLVPSDVPRSLTRAAAALGYDGKRYGVFDKAPDKAACFDIINEAKRQTGAGRRRQ